MKVANFPGGRAVIIGIANYSRVPQLPESVLDDARDVAALLMAPEHCGYDPANVCLLIDDHATLNGIRLALDDVARSCVPDDTIVVFFSGHGAETGAPTDPTSALVPVDCDPSDVDATALREAEFSAALAKIPAKRLFVVLDACHSGGAGSFKSGGTLDALRFGFNDKSLARLAQGAGRVLMASSRSTETSLILHGARNSLFTEHLLTALRGGGRTAGDGLIRVFDVFNYVTEHVQMAAPGRQHPIFKASDLEENFPIALNRGGAKSTGRSNATSAGPKRWRDLEALLPDLYPAGPRDQGVWERAGGDASRLELIGTGRAIWFTALRTLSRGGGGPAISRRSLIATAMEDYPHHLELAALRDQCP